MIDSLKELWAIFDRKKKEIAIKNKTNSFTNEQINRVLDWDILDPFEDKNRPKDNTAINLSPKTLLSLQWLSISDLEWKKIIDIWAGFTWIPFLLDWLDAEYNVVDPIFATDLLIEITRNKKKILDLVSKFDEINYDFYKKWETDKQKYYYNLNYEFNNILSDLGQWESVNDFNFIKWKTKIKIHPTTWEEISEIEDNTVDIIFINHTITKIQVNPYKLLEKAYKLLKVWGKIYITENWNFNFTNFNLANFWEFETEVIKTDNEGFNNRTILILEKK
jgi:SAM-dependent methyltransferase